jgi:hypothetical protein
VRFFLFLLATGSAACGVPLMKLPAGPGVPVAADVASNALAQATAACRAIRTLTAEVAVSGSVGGHRLRGRLSAGVAKPASARIEAVAPFGPPLFIFVATGDDAMLLLPRDERVLEHGRADAVLDAVAGVPLGAGDLEATLTGCAPPPATTGLQVRQVGAAWQIATGASGDELYLHRDAAAQPWRLVALVRRPSADRAWRVDYSDHQNGLPRTIRVASVDARNPGSETGAAFSLRLVLSQIETNVPLDANAFSIHVPRSAQPITLDELRRSGPLAPKSDAK